MSFDPNSAEQLAYVAALNQGEFVPQWPSNDDETEKPNSPLRGAKADKAGQTYRDRLVAIRDKVWSSDGKPPRVLPPEMRPLPSKG